MSKNDTIADTFTMIRNAIMAKKKNLDVPASNSVKSIMDILKNENYIDDFKVMQNEGKQNNLRIYLKYSAGKSAIKNLKRISRCGLRVYAKTEKIPSVLRGRGIAIVSTSKGIVTGFKAKELGVGGEVIGYIW